MASRHQDLWSLDKQHMYNPSDKEHRPDGVPRHVRDISLHKGRLFELPA